MMTYQSSSFTSSIRAVFRITLIFQLTVLVGCQDSIVGVKPVYRAGEIAGLGLEDSANERGKEYFSAGSFGLSVKYFRIAVAVNPASIGALNGLAASYDQIGRYDLAARYYRRALVMDPDSLQTLNNLGYSNYLHGRFDLAIAYLSAASAAGVENEIVATNRRLVAVGQASVTAATDEAKSSVRPSLVSAREVIGSDRPRSAFRIQRTSPAIQTLLTKPKLERVSTDAAVTGRSADDMVSTFRPWRGAMHASTGPGQAKIVSRYRRTTNSRVEKVDRTSSARSDPYGRILIAGRYRPGDHAAAPSRPRTVTTRLRQEVAKNAVNSIDPDTDFMEIDTQPLEQDRRVSGASEK